MPSEYLRRNPRAIPLGMILVLQIPDLASWLWLFLACEYYSSPFRWEAWGYLFSNALHYSLSPHPQYSKSVQTALVASLTLRPP